MKQDEPALDSLLARLAEGDRSAFAPFFKVLWPRVQGLCMALLRHPQDADDAAQQALEKILMRASEYDPSRPALPWTLAIAAWECRSLRRRKERRREASEDTLERLPSATTLEDDLGQRELEGMLGSALAELSPADRETLLSFYSREAQAASPTLRKRKQRAVARLKLAFRRRV